MQQHSLFPDLPTQPDHTPANVEEPEPSYEQEEHRPARWRVNDLPLDEQPVNRLHQVGARAMSTSEVLALVLQTPDALALAQEMLSTFDDLADIAKASMTELQAFNGIGKVTAARIKAAFEFGRRLLATPPAERKRVTSPADAADLLMSDMMLLEQEEMRLILLDTRNHVLGIPTIYKGSLNSAVVRIGELFRAALRANAAAFIVAHNHPSGDPAPSPEDVHVTRQIVKMGDAMDIQCLDHIVIGRHRYVSLNERGLGFD